MRAGELERMSDDELRRMLRRGVDRQLRRELELEIAWRQARGQPSSNRPLEYLPAFLLVDPVVGRQT